MQNKRDIEIMIGVLLIMSTVASIVTLLFYDQSLNSVSIQLAIHGVISVLTLTTAVLVRRSSLVPGFISALGFIGSLMTFLRGMLLAIGSFDKLSVWAILLITPLIGYEISLAVQVMFKGFTEKLLPPIKQNLFRLADKDRSDL